MRFCNVASAVFALLAIGYVSANPTPAPLPSGFTGRWSGIPQYTPVGPMNNALNFSVKPMEGTDGATWLMYSEFDGYLAVRSKQQFWVSSTYVNGSSGATTSTLTYCGALRNFFIAAEPEYVQVDFIEVARNDTFIAWNLTSQPMVGWSVTGQWTMQLLDDDTLQSIFMMPADEVTHAQMVFKRWGPRVEEAPKPAWFGFGPPCYNFTDELKPQSKCPLGFTHGKPPAHVQAIIDANNAAKQKIIVKEEPKPASYLGYDSCYVVNLELNFTVRWTMHHDTQIMDVVISATPTVGDASNQFVAIGIMGNWPLMQNADIIMGYFAQNNATQGCVRSLYAEYQVGTPVDSTNQTITNQKLWKENATLFVGFSRPFNTGHHNVMNITANAEPWVMPSIMFASGGAGDECTGKPGHYHFGNRGTYGFLWEAPQFAMPATMKCQ